MKKRVLCGLLSAFMLLTVVGGCGNKEADSEVIKIGGIGPLSGPNSTYGISVKQGALLLQEEINAAGGINGKKVEFIFEDDQAAPASAIQAFNSLVDQDGVCAIFGPVTSGATNAVAPNATKSKIPLITPTATEPTITNKGGEYVFRGCFVDSFQGEVLSKYAKDDLKVKTAAVLYNSGSDYSKGIADSFKADFTQKGGQVVEFLSYNDGDNDFNAQLTSIKGKNPDVLILPDYYNVVSLIAKQAREKGITAQFLGGDGWESTELKKLGGDAVNGAIYINHYYSADEDENVKNFVTSYKEKYGAEPDAFAALSYDSAKVLIEAIKKSGSTEGPKIMEALKGIEIESVTGKIKFDESRSAVKSAALIKVDGDKKVLVDKIMP